jgi:hypothetical protein
MILAGHGRVAACKQLHIKTVPTICLEHLTDAQRLAFMIADNRLTENSTWDVRLLGEQLQILSTANLDFDMEITGFEMAEIDIYIEGLKAEDTAAHDPADDVPDSESVVSVSKPDDIWCLGKHRLQCNCRNPDVRPCSHVFNRVRQVRSRLTAKSYTRLLRTPGAGLAWRGRADVSNLRVPVLESLLEILAEPSTLKFDETGEPFQIQQASQIRAFRSLEGICPL